MANGVYSQSEVQSYLYCKRQHYYAFGEPCPDGSRGIAPKVHGEGLTKGNIGHELLANYYGGLRDGLSVKNASEQALAEHYEQMLANPGQMSFYNDITLIFSNYVSYYSVEMKEWEVIAIEKEFRYDIPELPGLSFAFKPDAVMRERATGKVYIWDHKFLYNYYQPRVLGIMPQMAKYYKALSLMGYKVEDGIYNQLSTRKNSRDPFKRIPTEITKAKADQFWEEQLEGMRQIEEIKTQISNEEWRKRSLRTASAFNCGHCPFLELCTFDVSKANGRNLLLRQTYEPNTYGYGKDVDGDAA